MLKNYRLRDFDFKLILMIIALSVIGCLAIGSAEPSLQNKQIVGVVIGILIMLLLIQLIQNYIIQKHLLEWLVLLMTVVETR